MTKKKIVYLGDEKIQIESNPKVNKTKAKKVEVADIEQTPEPEPKVDKKPKKDPRPLTDEEKAERARKAKARRQENEWRELIAEKRRPLIAKALWKMYQMGELIPQHIKYKSDIGEIDQQFLYSHVSRFAI